jgi:beta-galactosidase
MQHRIDDVRLEGDELVVETRVAPAANLLGLATTYRWSAHGPELRLVVSVRVEGDWPCPLPRLGVRLALPSELDTVSWFGGGPGEAYRDSRQAARIGTFSATVDELQTPYVFPQENGNRMAVRWLELRDAAGRGLRVSGAPLFDFTARRWTSHDLDDARHTTDLRKRDAVFLNLDAAQRGLGSASCGPGVLPEYELLAADSEFELRFSRVDR